MIALCAARMPCGFMTGGSWRLGRHRGAAERGGGQDLFDPSLTLPKATWDDLRAMVLQVRRFSRCMRMEDPWGALCQVYPDLIQAVDGVPDGAEASLRASVLGLIGTYVAEWQALPRHFHRNWLQDVRQCAAVRGRPAVHAAHPQLTLFERI